MGRKTTIITYKPPRTVIIYLARPPKHKPGEREFFWKLLELAGLVLMLPCVAAGLALMMWWSEYETSTWGLLLNTSFLWMPALMVLMCAFIYPFCRR